MGRRLVFIFLFFFVNRFVLFFFVQCFTIIIIKCKASFSCHSSSSHYSTQGFILISFHFIFSFLKNKILCNFTCMWPSVVFTDIRIKMWTGMREKYDKKLPSKWILERKCFCFLITPSCFNKQKKCRYDRTFKERSHLAYIPVFQI